MHLLLKLDIDVDPELPPYRGGLREATERLDRLIGAGEQLIADGSKHSAMTAWFRSVEAELTELFGEESVVRAARAEPGSGVLNASIPVVQVAEKLLNIGAQITLDSFRASRADLLAAATPAGDDARLLMHASDARRLLRRQIRRGERLLMGDRRALLPSHERTYREYNDRLLRLLFDRTSVAQQFGATHFDDIELDEPDFQIARQVERLRQLSDTIHLHPTLPRAAYDAIQPAASRGAAARAVPRGNRVFVVHGHHLAYREALARLLERFGITAVILDEQPNAGATIVEKFEREAADVSYAIVLATADDLGQAKGGGRAAAKARARQNVVFELGYFVGKLGRDRVCLLMEPSVELFSDFSGVAYHPLGGDWKMRVATELKKAGFAVDLNALA